MTSTSQTFKAWSEAERKFREDNAELLAEVESIKSRARAMVARFTEIGFTDSFDLAESAAYQTVLDVRVDPSNSQTFRAACSDYDGTVYHTFPLEWLDLSEEDQVKAYKAHVRERARAERDPMI